MVVEIVTALSERKSVWHDLDVLRGITDRFQTRKGIDGQRWAGVLDRALTQVIESCVGLDPEQRDDEAGRGSDGRTVWIEPVAPRWSSPQVIDQELDLLAWTLGRQRVGAGDEILLTHMEHHSNIHRGVYLLSEEATRIYEGTREKVRRLLGARETREIVFLRGTTEGLNLLAWTLGRQRVVAGGAGGFGVAEGVVMVGFAGAVGSYA